MINLVKFMLTIRPAEIDDLGRITEIYNQAIVTTTATFDTEPKSVESQREWFLGHDAKYPIIVAEMNDEVVAWASLTKWSDRCGYVGTAEVSLYVEESFRGQGIGKKMFAELLAVGEAGGLHTAIARIVEGNDLSVKMHEAFGFTELGVMREVGEKFGKRLSVHVMQRMFSDS